MPVEYPPSADPDERAWRYMYREDDAEENPLALDFFSAGVPTGLVFQSCLSDLEHVINLAQITEVSWIAELCLIGLVSYFEAFCKDHAAAIINIFPDTIDNLRMGGHDTKVEAHRVLDFGPLFSNKIGSILTENYDFGSAKRINAIFSALLKITPFSKSEAETYEALLRDRNLVVHHGGVYTAKYREQVGSSRPKISDVYWNNLIIKPENVIRAGAFLQKIAKKTVHSSHEALSTYIEKIQLPLEIERRKALKFLSSWQEDRETFS